MRSRSRQQSTYETLFTDRLRDMARFCAFLDGYDGHPLNGFREWMALQGAPLSERDLKAVEEEYDKPLFKSEII